MTNSNDTEERELISVPWMHNGRWIHGSVFLTKKQVERLGEIQEANPKMQLKDAVHQVLKETEEQEKN